MMTCASFLLGCRAPGATSRRARSPRHDPPSQQFPKEKGPGANRGREERLYVCIRYATALARAMIIAPANTAAASFLSPPADMRGSAAPLTVRRITGHVQYAF